MIIRMDHLNLVVSDLAEAKRFFLLLGFSEGISAELDAGFLEQVTGIAKASGRFVALQHPGSNLALELLQFDRSGAAAEELGRADRIGLRHLAFAVSDIEAEVLRLKAQGVRFLGEIQTWQHTGKRLVYFYGPDGILLELAQYPDRQ